MSLLLLVSLTWAFSFGLIGNVLKGLDSSIVAAARLFLSCLVFAPLAVTHRLRAPLATRLMLLGVVQFGLMYLLYIASFNHLPSHQVALFTIFTPLHIAVLAHWRQPREAVRPLLAALLAVLGSGILLWKTPEARHAAVGFFLVQASNFCFAAGQLGYRRLLRRHPAVHNLHAMPWMFLGALLATLPFACVGWRSHGFSPTPRQLVVLLYLGVVASGVCFWLWNAGARRVNAGTLAVLNNAKIPLAVAVSLLCFREHAQPWRLVAAVVLIAVGVWLCESRTATSSKGAQAET